jgi:hypothetical protein
MPVALRGPNARSRRSFGLGLFGLALAGCEGRGAAPTRAGPGPGGTVLDFAATDVLPGGGKALLLAAPEGADRPLLVALHGRGESRSVQAGAFGYRDDYEIGHMLARLRQPPLTAGDLRGLVTPERLAALNASLAKAPFAGLSLLTPYAPDLADRSADGARGYGAFVTETLLPRAAEALGARGEWGERRERTRTGIDGISMGGRLSLFVGLSRPDVFGTVGATQPALDAAEAPLFSALAARAMEKAPVRLRLLTSEGDYFLRAVEALAERLIADRVPHELTVAKGPHDYVFNRGPGAAELLLWHERALRGLVSP